MKHTRAVIVIIWMLISTCSAGELPVLSALLEDAGRGNAEAMCDLGIAYFYGKQTLKDPFTARCWIKRAHEKGSDRARTLWNTLELWRYPGNCEDVFDDLEPAGYRGGEGYIDPGTGMEFVFVPGGCFLMGCPPLGEKCNDDERPAHKVCLEGFWMGKYEVSQAQWHGVMGQNPSRFNAKGDRPVENVSFDDIQTFIRRMPATPRGTFSLPTEAQWEYACRNGGESVNFPWGNDAHRPDANCGTCNAGDFHGKTSPCGSFFPNDLGLYDMAGNVKEWCNDIYDKKAYAEQAKKKGAYEKKGSSRVVRGGSFSDNASRLRCSGREKSIPGMRSDNLGFRLVLIGEK